MFIVDCVKRPLMTRLVLGTLMYQRVIAYCPGHNKRKEVLKREERMWLSKGAKMRVVGVAFCWPFKRCEDPTLLFSLSPSLTRSFFNVLARVSFARIIIQTFKKSFLWWTFNSFSYFYSSSSEAIKWQEFLVIPRFFETCSIFFFSFLILDCVPQSKQSTKFIIH